MGESSFSNALTKPHLNPMPKSVFGLLIFIATELMFFAGLLSAFWVLKSHLPSWPPLDQPRYPLSWTTLNTIILLLSGAALWQAEIILQSGKNHYRTKFLGLTLASLFGGLLFLTIQGLEWIQMIHFGIHATQNVYGGLFYLIVGAHGFHALIGLMVLVFLVIQALRKCYTPEKHEGFRLGRIYWLFVVLLWPILYAALYWG